MHVHNGLKLGHKSTTRGDLSTTLFFRTALFNTTASTLAQFLPYNCSSPIMAAPEKKPSLGKVLVIGGNGFLGHHVVAQIIEEGWTTSQVSVIDLKCTRNRRPDADKVNYVEANITDEAAMLSVFSDIRPDVVIHTASPAAQGDDAVARELFKKVNVDGTKSILDACLATGVKALVYTSSASIMSDNKSDLYNADERWPVIRGDAQSEYYSETKVCLPSVPSTSLNSLTASILPSHLSIG
jgi:sterol-4alpha-carboxylate 3-dehydrogenase (decarboxylating)